jgi:hypothetical protein
MPHPRGRVEISEGSIIVGSLSVDLHDKIPHNDGIIVIVQLGN